MKLGYNIIFITLLFFLGCINTNAQYASRFFADSTSSEELKHKIDSLASLVIVDSISYAKKVTYAKKVKKQAQLENDTTAMCYSTMNLAHFYFKMGAFKTAQVLIKESQDLAEAMNDSLFMMRSNLLKGNYYLELKEYDRAIVALRKGYSLRYEGMDEYSGTYPSIVSGITVAYNGLEEVDSSQFYVEKLKTIADSTRSITFKATAYLNIGETYVVYEETHDLAREYFLKAKEIALEIGLLEIAGFAHLSLGKLYVFEKKYAEAEKEFSESTRILKEVDAVYVYGQNLIYSARMYAEMGKHEKANKIFEDYIYLTDSLYNSKSKLQISELQELHNLEDKDRKLKTQIAKIKLLEQEDELNRSKIYIFASAFGITVLIAFLVFYRNSKRREIQKVKSQLMSSELERSKYEKIMLNEELRLKNKDLTNFAIDITRKQEFTHEVLDRLKELNKISELDKRKGILKDLIFYIKGQLNIDEGLKVFQQNIEQVNYEFFEKLEKRFPNLTPGEKDLCGLIRLNLTNKEVAVIKDISPKAAKVNRYRLRKKLVLEPEQDIHKYLVEL